MSEEATSARVLYSIASAADALDVKRSTIYTLIKQGQLDRIHVGRRALVTRTSLAAYVARQMSAARP